MVSIGSRLQSFLPYRAHQAYYNSMEWLRCIRLHHHHADIKSCVVLQVMGRPHRCRTEAASVSTISMENASPSESLRLIFSLVLKHVQLHAGETSIFESILLEKQLNFLLFPCFLWERIKAMYCVTGHQCCVCVCIVLTNIYGILSVCWLAMMMDECYYKWRKVCFLNSGSCSSIYIICFLFCFGGVGFGWSFVFVLLFGVFVWYVLSAAVFTAQHTAIYIGATYTWLPSFKTKNKTTTKEVTEWTDIKLAVYCFGWFWGGGGCFKKNYPYMAYFYQPLFHGHLENVVVYITQHSCLWYRFVLEHVVASASGRWRLVYLLYSWFTWCSLNLTPVTQN